MQVKYSKEIKQKPQNRVVQSCHLLVCLFIYRHFTAKLTISEYDRWHLFVTYYAYLILTYCWFDSNVDKQKISGNFEWP